MGKLSRKCESVDSKALLPSLTCADLALVLLRSVAEPIPECDVEQWNKHFMLQSEELYDALMDCHWEPLDSIDSPIPPCS